MEFDAWIWELSNCLVRDLLKITQGTWTVPTAAQVFSLDAKNAAVPRYIGQINRNAETCDKSVFKYKLWMWGGFKITVVATRTREMRLTAASNFRHLTLATERFLSDLLQCNLFVSHARLYLLHKRLVTARFSTNFLFVRRFNTFKSKRILNYCHLFLLHAQILPVDLIDKYLLQASSSPTVSSVRKLPCRKMLPPKPL